MAFLHFGTSIYDVLVAQQVMEPETLEKPLVLNSVFYEPRNIQVEDFEFAAVLESYLPPDINVEPQKTPEVYGPFFQGSTDLDMIENSVPDKPAFEKAGVEKVYNPSSARPPYENISVVGRPKVAIIIDDMGMNRKNSLKLVHMNEKLTLAFLPYAPGLAQITSEAQERGHELIIHMPMEAIKANVSLGSIALKSGMSQDEVNLQLDKAFASFDGYKGLNNHMGSMVTQDPQIMGWVMQRLKSKGLYFLDSVTISSSVAENVARDFGLAAAHRDVFLDHEDSLQAVRKALERLELTANRQGYAIAIGHPKDATIQGLQEWLPQAKEKGYELVFASELVSKPKENLVAVSEPANMGASDAAEKLLTMPETGNRAMSYEPFLIEPAAGAEVIRWE